MPSYRVLREGISQRVNSTEGHADFHTYVDRHVDDVITVSDIGAPGLLTPVDVAQNGAYIVAV